LDTGSDRHTQANMLQVRHAITVRSDRRTLINYGLELMLIALSSGSEVGDEERANGNQQPPRSTCTIVMHCSRLMLRAIYIHRNIFDCNTDVIVKHSKSCFSARPFLLMPQTSLSTLLRLKL
jgi:hypothetical protein